MRGQRREHVERCEAATTPASQCRCRCGGRCHGRLLVAQGAGREAFEQLPADDPHHLQTSAERRTAAREKRAGERRTRLDRDRRAHIEDVRRRNPRHARELEARWFGAAASAPLRRPIKYVYNMYIHIYRIDEGRHV